MISDVSPPQINIYRTRKHPTQILIRPACGGHRRVLNHANHLYLALWGSKMTQGLNVQVYSKKTQGCTAYYLRQHVKIM